MSAKKAAGSSYINHFLQPDTIIPNASPQSLNRYSYVLNSPVRYHDPSGHKACVEWNSKGKCVEDPEWHPGGLGRYGITARGVSKEGRSAIRGAAKDIAYALWGVLGYENYTSLSAAFTAVYSGGVTFQQSDESCAQANGDKKLKCWGKTENNGDGSSTITIYTDAIGKESGIYYNQFLFRLTEVA